MVHVLCLAQCDEWDERIGGVCEICMWLGRRGRRWGEWMRGLGLGLGFTNPVEQGE